MWKEKTAFKPPEDDVAIGEAETPENALLRLRYIEAITKSLESIQQHLAAQKVGDAIARKIDEA